MRRLFKIDQTAGVNPAMVPIQSGAHLGTVAVRYYNFAMDNGSGPDDLGGIALADDDEAIAFGKQVIQDLKGFQDLQGSVGHYARWSMNITEGERVVGTIPFEVDH